MSLLTGFDAGEVEPNTPFETLPAGEYIACITEGEEKVNKDGKGKHLSLKFQVTEGPCKNRTVFVNLNLEHANPQTVQIARGELSAICRACNVLKPGDVAALYNIPINIRVTTRKDAATNKEYNDVKGFAKYVPAGNAPADKPATMPWKKGV